MYLGQRCPRAKIGLTIVILACLVVPAMAVKNWNSYPQHDKFWTGRVNKTQETTIKKQDHEVMYGKDTKHGDKWQGWIKIGLADIPDEAVIEEATLCYHIISPTHKATHTLLTVLEHDPVTAGAEQIWDDIVGGTVVDGDLYTGAKDWVERPLNAAGIAALQAALADDWIAFGLYKWSDDDNKGHVKGYGAHPHRPYLALTFSQNLPDMVMQEICTPAGAYNQGAIVPPTVVVANAGDLVLPFSVWVILRDSRGLPVYLQQLTFPGGMTPGAETTLVFPNWTAGYADEYSVEAKVEAGSDADLSNNELVDWFDVLPSPGTPPSIWWGWREMDPMPYAPSMKPVRKGAWLTIDPQTGIIYGARGYKTGDFFSYDAYTHAWTELAPIPGKKVGKKGARGVVVGGSVFLVNGGNTVDFLRYDIAQNTWESLPAVPEGTSGKRVKDGADVVHVVQYGLDYIYLLKGKKCDFMRYCVQAQMWDDSLVEDAPAGMKPKWKKGSWLVYDGGSKLYAHKSYYHEMWVYDMEGDTWLDTPLAGMPLRSPNPPYKKKKVKAGGCAVYYDGNIYALKGGKTQEFWWYDVSQETWTEHEPVPLIGVTLKDIRVGEGADMVMHPFSQTLFALKGRKSLEFWRYYMPPPSIDGVQAQPVSLGHVSSLSVYPDPVAGNVAKLHYSVPATGPASVTMFDAVGRMRVSRRVELDREGQLALHLDGLSKGTYFLTVSGDGYSLKTRMVVSH